MNHQSEQVNTDSLHTQMYSLKVAENLPNQAYNFLDVMIPLNPGQKIAGNEIIVENLHSFQAKPKF